MISIEAAKYRNQESIDLVTKADSAHQSLQNLLNLGLIKSFDIKVDYYYMGKIQIKVSPSDGLILEILNDESDKGS